MLPTSLVLLLLAGATQPALSPDAPALPPLKYVDVAESVVMLQNDKPYGSNITCFVIEEGLVFVDTGLFTDIAARFRHDMETRFGKKTLVLLLSHAHIDHFLGMGAFSDVPVVAAAKAKGPFRYQLAIDFNARVEAYMKIFPKFDEALETARPFMPNIWFETEIEFGAGEDRVRFRRTSGHSTGSSFVHAPAAGVIAAGDNLQVDAFPYFGDPSTDMTLWIDTLEQWESLGPISFCPGHGRPVDLAYLVSTKVFFQDLVSALRALEEKGIPVEEAVSHPSLPRGYWGSEAPEPPWYRPAIAALYRSLMNQ